MNNLLLAEIASLHDLIDEHESQHFALLNSGADENILHHSKARIDDLKQRLQALEDLLLDDSFSEI